MTDSHNPPARRKLSVSQRLEIDGLCSDFDRAWREQSEPPRISEFLTPARRTSCDRSCFGNSCESSWSIVVAAAKPF